MLATTLLLLSATTLPQGPGISAPPVAINELGDQGNAGLRALLAHDNRPTTAVDNAAITASPLLATDIAYFGDPAGSARPGDNTGPPTVDLDAPTRTDMLETRAGGPVLQDSAMAGAGGPGRRGHYVGFDLGVSSPTDSKFSGLFNSAQASFDTGFTIGAAYGYHYTDKLRVEADLGYRKSDLDKVTIGGVTLDGSGDMSTLTLLANGYYDFDLGGPVAPYVGFGFGMAIVDVDTSDTESRVSVDDSGTTFAFNLMAGVSYGVGDNVDLDLGYRYLGAIDPELDATFAPGGILGGGTTTVNVDVEVHEIFLGMRYTF